MTPPAGRRRPRRTPTLKTVNALAQVLAGRDAAPVWRSAAARRVAYAAAAAGWALLAVAAIAEVAIGVRRPHGPHGTDLAGWLAGTLAVSAALLLAPRFPLIGLAAGLARRPDRPADPRPEPGGHRATTPS